MAFTIIISVTKPSKDTRLGIGLTDQRGQIRVTSIAEDGLFANTDLKVCWTKERTNPLYAKSVCVLNTINDQVPASSKEAVSLLKEAEHEVVVVASMVGALFEKNVVLFEMNVSSFSAATTKPFRY